MIGIGDWKANSSALAETLQGVLQTTLQAQPFRFARPEDSCLLRVLQGQAGYVTVVANSGTQPVSCHLTAPHGSRPQQLWGPSATQETADWSITLAAGATSVLAWSSAPQ
jgi:hypothetical protein